MARGRGRGGRGRGGRGRGRGRPGAEGDDGSESGEEYEDKPRIGKQALKSIEDLPVYLSV